jgi:ribosomal protein L33
MMDIKIIIECGKCKVEAMTKSGLILPNYGRNSDIYTMKFVEELCASAQVFECPTCESRVYVMVRT